MNTVNDIKWKIKDIIVRKGISIYELSNKADLTSACIRNWFSKRDYTPSLSALLKLCNALEISPIELFKNEDDEQMYVTKEEKLLLQCWSKLNKKQKSALLLTMNTMLDKD